jgi:signal peptidase II
MHFELLAAAAFILLVDRLSKKAIARRLAKGCSAPVNGCVRIERVINPIGTGLFGRNPFGLVFVWGFSLGILVLVSQQGYFFSHPAAQVGLGLGLGGASSNLYDWLRSEGVMDFVKIGWWPVFNLADVGICVGAAAALWFMR